MGCQLSSTASGMSFWLFFFLHNFSGMKRTCWTTGSWRSCLSLEVVSSIPAGSAIIYLFCWFIGVSLCQSIKIKPANIINGVHGPEPKSSGGNTSPDPQVSALIPRHAFYGMERMGQRHRSNQNSHPLVRKPLCNQFIHYHISSRGVFVINPFKLRNFAVVVI